jgi:hypothetical protein
LTKIYLAELQNLGFLVAVRASRINPDERRNPGAVAAE